MNRRFYVGISINPTDEKRRLVVIGATPTRKKCTKACWILVNVTKVSLANFLHLLRA